MKGFCLAANGYYIGIEALQGVRDAEVMIDLSNPLWGMVLFGFALVFFGLFLWNGIGKYFGLGIDRGEIEKKQSLFLHCLNLADDTTG